MEIWLRGNPRSSWLPAGAAALLFTLAAISWLAIPSSSAWRLALAVPLTLLALVGVSLAGLLQRAARIGFDGRHVLLYIRPGAPQALPLDVVEVFFLGQGEGATGDHHPTGPPLETANVVVRIAERAHEYQQGSAAKLLAHWCGGYITIYGTWCQPLDAAAIIELNRKLTQAKRAARQEAPPASQA
jgi:hypothetical protein